MVINLLLMASMTYAQDFQNVKQGQIVPFDGTIVTPNGLATIITKQDADLAMCEETKNHEIESITIDKDTEIKNLKFELVTCNSTKEEIVGQKDKEIDRLYKIIEKPKSNLVPLWIGVGFMGGIVTSLGTYYVYNNF